MKHEKLNVPLRMYTSEVCSLARFGQGKLNALRKAGKFPNPICRGKEAIYDGRDVYRALGLLDGETTGSSDDDDPIMKAIEKMSGAFL